MTAGMNPSVIPEQAFARILADLDSIERRENVRIIFAVESGSRAWGFPSPDSDFDARFVYVRTRESYLSLRPARDVIELPIDGDFDVNGWDIRKALQLLLKPNPVLLEWLSSPIRYRWNEAACAQLRQVAEDTAYADACLRHYLSLSQRLWAEYVERREKVNLKKYLYILRPALCIAWIREQPGSIPPMNLRELMAGLDLDAAFLAEVDGLLARKAQASELGEGERIAALDKLIMREWAWASAQERHAPADESLLQRADQLFMSLVEQQA